MYRAAQRRPAGLVRLLEELGRVHGRREGKHEAAWGGWPPKPDQRLMLKLEGWKDSGGEGRMPSTFRADRKGA